MSSPGILRQYIEDFQNEGEDHVRRANEWSDSWQKGPDGQPIYFVSDGFAGQNVLSGAGPVMGYKPMYGKSELQPMGLSKTERDIHGNPAMQWGLGGKVMFVDYGTNPYHSSQKQKGERFYIYTARKPKFESITDSRQFLELTDAPADLPPDSQYYTDPLTGQTIPVQQTYYKVGDKVYRMENTPVSTTDEMAGAYNPLGASGSFSPALIGTRFVDAKTGEELTDVSYDEEGQRYYTGKFDVKYRMPTDPGEFKGKAPSFTRAQEKKLLLPDRSHVLSGTDRAAGGVISRFLGRVDEE